MSQLLISPEGTEYGFQESERLGNGAFGDVYKGFDRKNLKNVAIKRVHNTVLDKYGEEFIRCLGNEANILQEMGTGVHTVAIIDCFQTANHVNIIMEFCDGGTLTDKLYKAPDGSFEEGEALTYFAEMVDGLYAIHKSGRMHRDMKLDNVFLKDGHCKIGDFGFATKQEKSDQYVGTPEYMAPEIFDCGDGNYYGKEVDIWALGVILHEMLFGNRPYSGPQTQLGDIIRSTPYIPPSYPITSPQVKELLKRMFTVDKEKRIKIEEIKNFEIVKAKATNHASASSFQIKNYESDDGKSMRKSTEGKLINFS
jgi:serine/threonine protein kinase